MGWRLAMSTVSVVLAHGPWADGPSWAGVISPLIEPGDEVSASARQSPRFAS